MPFLIQDEVTEDLARRVQQATGARSASDAVRIALEHEIERIRSVQAFDRRNAGVMAMADALGATDPSFDRKRYADALWNDE